MRAYAKINLGLVVFEKREDGYHDIETVFHRIDLFDEVTIEQSDAITVVSSDRDVPNDETNICYKTAKVLQQHLGVSEGVTISIRKNIPVGAGLGGGSSDAALVLQELPKFWQRSVDRETIRRMALQLGSDVPYFLGTGSALARGRGEILEYFQLGIPYTILLCSPAIHISTAWAYNNVIPLKKAVNLKGLLLEGINTPIRLVNGLRNDFEPLIFRHYPEIMRVKEAMMRGGAEFALMSGSGSSVYGFFSRTDFADEVAKYFKSMGYRTYLTGPHFSPS